MTDALYIVVSALCISIPIILVAMKISDRAWDMVFGVIVLAAVLSVLGKLVLTP